MDDDLKPLIDLEYGALTKWVAEFTARNRTAAGRLRLSGPEVDDPHVKRLLEGVAFLGARVRQRLDDEFPELTDALERTNASRRVGRGAMIRLALAEGMTTTELAARLGISRQLVCRYRDET